MRIACSMLPLPSIGWPSPLSTRPSSPGPTSDAEAAAERRDRDPGMQSVDVAERHEQHAALVKADDFGEHRFLVGEARDATELAQADVEPVGLDDESDDARHAAEPRQARQVPMRAAKRLRSIDQRHAMVRALERGVDSAVDDAVAAFDETAAPRDAHDRRASSRRASR